MEPKHAVAVIFVGKSEAVIMELSNAEFYNLQRAKTDQRFVKLENAYHNLDRIENFWELGTEAEIG